MSEPQYEIDCFGWNMDPSGDGWRGLVVRVVARPQDKDRCLVVWTAASFWLDGEEVVRLTPGELLAHPGDVVYWPGEGSQLRVMPRDPARIGALRDRGSTLAFEISDQPHPETGRYYLYRWAIPIGVKRSATSRC